jgi:hypothetical protein
MRDTTDMRDMRCVRLMNNRDKENKYIEIKNIL